MIFRVKNTQILWCGSESCQFWIRGLVSWMEKKLTRDPGSGTNIPDPQHCFNPTKSMHLPVSFSLFPGAPGGPLRVGFSGARMLIWGTWTQTALAFMRICIMQAQHIGLTLPVRRGNKKLKITITSFTVDNLFKKEPLKTGLWYTNKITIDNYVSQVPVVVPAKTVLCYQWLISLGIKNKF